MSELVVNTSISVVCIFKNGGFFPAYIYWNNQRIKMTTLDMVNRLNKGTELVYNLCASTSDACYQMRYETKANNWILEKIWYKE